MTHAEPHMPIAIVGVGCRFPGQCDSPAAYFRFLREGGDAIGELPRDRWDNEALYDADPRAPGRTYVRRGAFIDHAFDFDPELFGISPLEAQAIDPQQRLLLETSWDAIESSGRAPLSMRGSPTGVFVGIGQSHYATESLYVSDFARIGSYAASGSLLCFASGRLAHVLGVCGPTLSLDTACSSSLVALHLACAALARGECEMALAAGVHLHLSPHVTLFLSRTGVLAPDGRSKAFDDSADGFGRGEGCGVLVLRRLSDALSSRDPIVGVIRGSAINSDGAASGLTVPNAAAQEAVIRAAQRAAAVPPAAIGFIEAHGTGTRLGDPIEIEALSRVFAAEGAPSVALGAGKSSLGHLEAAAGIAGVLRALFVLEHQLVPPQVGLGQLTRAVAWDDLPFTIARTLSEPAAPIRFAGVSSFGMSGTNAHVILERAPLRDESSARDAAGPHILALSGHSVAALDAMLQDHAQVLATLPEHDFASFCAASQRVRASLRHRVAITAATPSEAHAAVCALRAGGAHPAAVRGDASLARSSSVAFMFTGQGSQWPAMARALYDAEPVFRSAIDRAGEIVDPLLPLPLGTLLLEECEPEILRATSCAQPALFTTAWALCQLWKSWGVEPDIVLGHSLGEYAAACVAGYFDFEAGLRLVARRAQLMQALPAHGAMLSVRLPAATLALRLRSYAGALEIAAINARNVTVVAGDEAAIGSLAKELGREGVGCKPLEVSHAFHCHHVDVVLPELAAAVRGVTFREPRAELISNLTGDFVELEQFASPEYFCKHTRATVQFAQAVSRLADAHVSAVVEIGPQPVLTGLARQSLPNAELVWLPSMQRGTDAVTLLRRSLAALHVRGVPTRLSATSEVTRHVSLPRYPFQRRTIRVTKAEPAPRLGEDASLRRLCLPHSREAHFELFVAQDDSVVREHRVFGQVVIPAAWHLAALASAAHSLAPSETITLREVSFVLAARVPPEGLVVHMAFLPGSDGELRFRLLSRASSADAHADASWRTHVSGIVSRDAAESRNKLITRDAIADGGRLEPTHFYDDLALRGFDLGPSFRWLEDLRADSALVLASLREPSHGAHSELAIHPGLLDTSFQLLSQLWPAQAHEQAFIPFRIARFELAHAASASPLNARAWRDEPALQPEAAMSAPAHVLLTRADGSRVMLAQGFVFRQVQRESLDAHGGTSVPAPAAPVASHATLLRELAPAQQRARLEEAVRAVIAQVLELVEPEHIAPRDRFFDLGFDSMRAVDAGEALEERLGLPLELTVFFDYPTLEALVDHLTEQLGGRPAEHHVRPGAAWLEPALSSLSEEEAEQLLLKQLERLS